MKTRMLIFVTVLASLILCLADFGMTQIRKQLTPAEIIEAMTPGQWLQLEGKVVQPGVPIVCTEVQFLTGDFKEDDWSITGIVRRVDLEKKEMELSVLLPIKIQEDTEFQNKDKDATFTSLDHVKVGSLAEADGTYLKDGTFLALEIEDEKEKLAEKPHLRGEIEATGRVGKWDADKLTITMMGITFQLNDMTKSRSVIK